MKMKKEKIEEMKKIDRKNKIEKKTKKIEKREIGIETEREEIVKERREKRDVEIATEIVIEKIDEKKETELRE